MKLTHSWKTRNNTLSVTATCELVLKETTSADGWEVEIDVCKKDFEISIKGMGIIGTYINREPVQAAGVWYPATCG